jgi:hypothetical protein
MINDLPPIDEKKIPDALACESVLCIITTASGQYEAFYSYRVWLWVAEHQTFTTSDVIRWEIKK